MGTERLLRIGEVETIVGMKKSAIYLRIGRDEFPRPIAFNSRLVRWRQTEIDKWLADLPVTVAAGRI